MFQLTLQENSLWQTVFGLSVETTTLSSGI